ncbi:MAG: hypothetical protein RIS47_867 [Bacteroidota bacterium]|jgi:gliding motility associated protien GldN
MKLNLFLIFALSTNLGMAQSLSYMADNTNKERKLIPYQYPRCADVAWEKVIWRLVDLNEKQNQYLYYPIEPTANYHSLISALIDLVQQKGINLYSEAPDEAQAQTVTKADMNARLGANIKIITPDAVGYEDSGIVVETPYDLSEIKRLLIKEVWFFDRERSVLDTRIVALCPVREYFREEDTDQEQPLYKKIAWFYYPEIEPKLANYTPMPGDNLAQPLSFADIFRQRQFKGHIVQISNMYDNRPISDYLVGNEALQESDRIEETIRKFEEDLWSN